MFSKITKECYQVINKHVIKYYASLLSAMLYDLLQVHRSKGEFCGNTSSWHLPASTKVGGFPGNTGPGNTVSTNIISHFFFSFLSKVKVWLRLSVSVSGNKNQLSIKNLLFDRAGVPNFPRDLRASGYYADRRSNCRLAEIINHRLEYKTSYLSSPGFSAQSQMCPTSPAVLIL